MRRSVRTRTARPVPLPKLVLFDLDDTIFDHTLTCRAALAAVRRAHPFLRRISLDEQLRTYHRLMAGNYGGVLSGRISSHEARRERFLRIAAEAGRPVGRDAADELAQIYRANYQRLRRPVPGAPEALRRVHAASTVGIVTNNSVAEQVDKLRFLGLEDAIDFMITSEEVGITKPDPAIFALALARESASPRDAVMVGDSWTSDVEGARAAGIRPLWFNRFRSPRPPGAPVAEFSSFKPATALVAALRAPHIGDGG